MKPEKYIKELEGWIQKNNHWSGDTIYIAYYTAMHMFHFTEIENIKDESCDGCKHLRGRHCILIAPNHCIRRAEDYYSKE